MPPDSLNTDSEEPEKDFSNSAFDTSTTPVAEPAPRLPNHSRRNMLAALAAASATGAVGHSLVKETALGKRLTDQGRHWKDRFANILEREWEKLGDRISPPPPTPRTLESEKEYGEFLGKIPLLYISPEEVIRPHRNIRNGVPNELPPRAYWQNIKSTLLVADKIRDRLGKPLHLINSAYRSPAYNKACPGAATWSYHMKNQALDLMFAGGPAEAAPVAKKLRAEKFFHGGIGIYPGFIHIDTRGFNATWES